MKKKCKHKWEVISAEIRGLLQICYALEICKKCNHYKEEMYIKLKK